MKLAIDFGTSNSLVAQWGGNTAHVLDLPSLSSPATLAQPSVIPSLVYVGQELLFGQAVLEQGLQHQRGNRLFRHFKRGIVEQPTPTPRYVDGKPWSSQDVGSAFVNALLQGLPYQPDDIEQLVLTAPVAAFQGYTDWLNQTFTTALGDKIRLVDESTAAALGYAITEPDATVLVFDFGGGTLDVSLVQLPESKDQTGGFLKRLLRGGNATARVIAKAGRVLGGSDIDHWLLHHALQQLAMTLDDLNDDYAALLTACEQAKIALSTEEVTEIAFQDYRLSLTRADLEHLLTEKGFYTEVRRVIEKVMHTARQRGIFKEDIQHVLMVGGMSLMPSVQATLKDYFPAGTVRADKPFTAIVEGALGVAAGFGLDDCLVNSYGIRYLDPATQTQHYDELIPMGSPLPLAEPVEVILCAAYDRQHELELVIGEINPDDQAAISVHYEGGQAVFTTASDHITAVNAAMPFIIPLKPHGKPGEDRLKVQFTIDAELYLRVRVKDLKTKKTLVDNAAIATVR